VREIRTLGTVPGAIGDYRLYGDAEILSGMSAYFKFLEKELKLQ